MSVLVRRGLIGALVGFIATGPMTIAMFVMHRMLPTEQRYPLPPWEITSEMVSETGAGDEVSAAEYQMLTLAMHFSYGAANGAVYEVTARKLPLRPTISAVLFSLLIWAGSYLGWLPMLNILRPATEHPAKRNVLMIAAHVVWGTTLGLLTSQLERRGVLS